MNTSSYKKSIAFLVIALFIGASFVPAMIGTEETRSSTLQVDIANIDQKRIQMNVNVPEFKTSIEHIGEMKFAFFELKDEGFIYNDGQAKLPKIRRMIEIPYGSNPIIQINNQNWETTTLDELNLPSRILPDQPPMIKSDQTNDIVIDEDYYNTNEFIPAETAKVLETNEIRGRRFALIEISPLRYNPAQGSIEMMISCDCTLNVADGINMDETIDNIEQYSTPSFEQMFANNFANYGYYEQFADESKDTEGFLIIVYDDFEEEISPLANWKTTMGYDTTVTLTSDIPGGATADNIKDYIQDAYDTWENPPAYILLVGDTPQIPCHTGPVSGGETDSLFVRVDGDDIFPDIYIGRFPADNESQVTNMVDKTVYYEQGDFPDIEWIKNATFIASSDQDQLAEDTHNYVINTHLDPNEYNSTRIYEASGGNTQDIYDSLNAGASLCVYSGHGSPSGWACVPFDIDDVYALENEGMYPFVCSHACSTSTYEGSSETFSEAWLRAPDKGGIAMWGSSVSTYWTEDDMIERRVFDAWWYDGMERIGQMTDQGMYDSYIELGNSSNMERFMESYNVMGDASVLIWSEDPFVPEHDIAVENLNIPDVVAHGETQTVSAQVRNVGNNTETNIAVDFIVNDSVLDTMTISSLDPMQSTQVSFTWNPDNGTYLVEIESQPIIDEYDLNNNNVNKTVEVIPAPAIEVIPLSLSFMVPTDATDTDMITISNLASAEAELVYNISFAGDLGGSWLSATPETGTVPVGGADSVTVGVNTSGLSEGDYAGEVIISSNDLDDAEVVVSVDLTVVYGDDFAAISVNGPIGSVPYGSYNVNATVQNMGFYDQSDVTVNCSIYEGFLDYFEDFETGDGEYSQSGGLWEYGSPVSGPSGAYSGSFCWGTNLDAEYVNDVDARLESGSILIPNGVTATLSFYQWYDIENSYDGGNVKVSTDDGATWSLISPVGGYPDDSASGSNEGIPGEPCFTGSMTSWEQVSFDLTGFAGESIRVRWHFGSDGSVTNPGWFIDDVRVEGEYGSGASFADNSLVFSTTELVSLDAYEMVDVLFSPVWVAGGGNYTIQITTMLAGDEQDSNDVMSDVVFVTGPSLSFSPSGYDFGTMMNDTSDSTSFEIWNSGVGTLTYTLDESCDWVDLSSYGGDSSGEHDTIIVDVDTTGLIPGESYVCDVNISSDGGTGVFSVFVYVVDEFTPIEDINQSVFDRGFPVRHAVDGDWAGAQNFSPSVGVITGADLYLRSFGVPEFDLVVELREGGPEGTLLDSVTFTPGEVPSDWEWFSVDFVDTPVVSGVDYFIVVPPAPGGVSSSFGYEWGYALDDVYDGGSFWFTRDGGSLWRDLPSMYEFTFATYGLM